jgi:hypothetical protein
MEGPACPLCVKPTDLLSTENEWKYYCRSCDIRFNGDREVLSTGDFGRDLAIFWRGFRVMEMRVKP